MSRKIDYVTAPIAETCAPLPAARDPQRGDVAEGLDIRAFGPSALVSKEVSSAGSSRG